MIRLKRLNKEEILYNMFPQIGDEHDIETILDKTGITSKGSLKVIMGRLKDTELFPEDKVIHLSQKNGIVMRIG